MLAAAVEGIALYDFADHVWATAWPTPGRDAAPGRLGAADECRRRRADDADDVGEADR